MATIYTLLYKSLIPKKLWNVLKINLSNTSLLLILFTVFKRRTRRDAKRYDN